MLELNNARITTNIKLTNVNSFMHIKYIIPVQNVIHKLQEKGFGMLMSSDFTFIVDFLFTNLATNGFNPSLMKPEQSTIKQIIKVIKNRLNNIFIVNNLYIFYKTSALITLSFFRFHNFT